MRDRDRRKDREKGREGKKNFAAAESLIISR